VLVEKRVLHGGLKMRRKKLGILLAATLLATTVTNPLAEVVAADAVQQPNQ
jgi:hypothetical protein